MLGKACRSVLSSMGLALLLSACSYSTFEPPERGGPSTLVETGNGRQLWLTTVQEEERSRRIGGGSRSIGKLVTDRYTHLRVQAHGPADANRVWLKELKVLKDDAGGVGARVRILGQHGDVVWVWVHDQPLALSARDASVLADRARLEQVNPELTGLFSNELKYYVMMDALVATLADGRHVRLRPPGFRAEPYEIANEEEFRMAGNMSSSWNGGYPTKAFGMRHGVFDGRWIGLLSDKEAKDGEDDSWGDHHYDAAEIVDEGDTARRRFRLAKTEVRKDAYGQDYVRLGSLPPMDGADTWLQGLLLKRTPEPGTPVFTLRGRIWKPTTGAPLQLTGPPGVLVLHRTRMDAQGRLAVSRLDAKFREQWRATLPYQELSNRWETGPQLLLYGSWNDAQPGMSDNHEALLALDLGSGRWSGWDIGAETLLAPAN